MTADKTISVVLEAEPEPTPEPTEEPTEEPTPEPTQEPTEAPISSYSVTFNLVKGQGYSGSVQEVKLYIDNVLTIDPKDGPDWTADGDGYTYTHTFNDGNDHTYNIDTNYSTLFSPSSGTVTPQTQTVNIEQIDK